MPCYHPIPGYRSKIVNQKSNKRSIVFNVLDAYDDEKLSIPCGNCIGCRLEKSRQWAIRCVHESSLYENNSFITLTYDQEHMPWYYDSRDDAYNPGNLNLEDFQNFMKRLRRSVDYDDTKYLTDNTKNIRFFHAGEYGGQLGRPHYHALLFNLDLPDRELLFQRFGNRIYTSETLSSIWGKGFVTLGDVTFESAAYVARYVMKKQNGSEQKDHYNGLKPEYTTMSRRPGIGSGWFEKYKSDVYPSGSVVLNGRKLTPPKFYETKYEKSDPFSHDDIKEIKRQNGIANAKNNTYDRLNVRETIQLAALNQLKREII